MKCATCLHNQNCQFLAKHKKAEVSGCTAYKNTIDFVEVVHGEWKECYDGFHDMITIVCSYCGHTGAKHFKFCPNCGAKMDGNSNE
jgi:hypothetical protein